MDFYKQTLLEQDSEMKQNLASDEHNNNNNNKKKKKKRKRTLKEPKSKDKQIMSDDKPKKCSGKGKRTRVCDIYNDAEDQYMCLERAAFLLERLDAESPKFAKCMLPSNVLYSFWLILPKKFCVMHLPEHDTTVTLVDETGKEFKTNYLKVRHGLSAGWRGFSIAQKLLQGDILFFHLVEPCKLQGLHSTLYRSKSPSRITIYKQLMGLCQSATSYKIVYPINSDKGSEGSGSRENARKRENRRTPWEPSIWTVNIVRRYGLETIEAAVCLMEMHPRVKKTRTSNYFEKSGEPKKEKVKKHKEAKKDKEGKQKNETPPMPIQTKKGKRTRRSPKKFIARLSLDFCERNVEEDVERVSCVDQCENSSDGLSSEVVQGSTLEMTNESQPDEVGCYALNLACHEDINCHSTTERIFHSSTVTT